MRDRIHDTLEKGRVRVGPIASDPGDLCGAFAVPSPGHSHRLFVVCSGNGPDGGEQWFEAGFPLPVYEHASVTTSSGQCPTWEEMCFVKALLWRADECVVQYMVPADSHVNNHEGCLHLWKVVGTDFPRPPALAVGAK